MLSEARTFCFCKILLKYRRLFFPSSNSFSKLVQPIREYIIHYPLTKLIPKQFVWHVVFSTKQTSQIVNGKRKKKRKLPILLAVKQNQLSVFPQPVLSLRWFFASLYSVPKISYFTVCTWIHLFCNENIYMYNVSVTA